MTNFKGGNVMFFENIQTQLASLKNHEIKTLDPDVIESDIKNFFSTAQNPYANGFRKMRKALKNSGLSIRKVKNDTFLSYWIPFKTTITYDLDLNGSVRKVFTYVWR